MSIKASVKISSLIGLFDNNQKLTDKELLNYLIIINFKYSFSSVALCKYIDINCYSFYQ